jgi:hypothetical protein
MRECDLICVPASTNQVCSFCGRLRGDVTETKELGWELRKGYGEREGNVPTAVFASLSRNAQADSSSHLKAIL